MVSSGLVSIRNESADLNIAKCGATHLYVDQNGEAASDNNDGYDWYRPFKTIMGAIGRANPWTEIWIKSGTYAENVVVPHQNIKLHGIIQDGTDRIVISPTSGIPLILDAGYCEVDGIALVSTNNHVLKANYPGHSIHNMYLELNNNTATTYSAVWFNDSDYSIIRDSYLQGLGNSNVIGVRVDGGSVDNGILGNYITGFGGVGTGYGVGLNDCQRCAILPSGFIPNRFVNNNVGVYCYVQAGYRGHAVMHNLFAQQSSYDIYDACVSPLVSGIVLRENCYVYTGWYSDFNHSGRASIIVNAFNNYDYSPLSNPWSISSVPRIGVV